MLVASNPVGAGRDGWTGADDPHGCTGGGATAADTPREGPCRCSAHAGDRGRARGSAAGRGGTAGGRGGGWGARARGARGRGGHGWRVWSGRRSATRWCVTTPRALPDCTTDLARVGQRG